MLVNSGGLWQRTVNEVAAEYPEVTVEYNHVDAATIYFVTDPERYDVIVTDNLFGDILTDLGAAIAGGIGLAASGNLDVSRDSPEHVRAGARLGAGHRRAGHGRPDGHRAFGGMLLDHLGFTEQAQQGGGGRGCGCRRPRHRRAQHARDR